jgi:hypothetical protein
MRRGIARTKYRAPTQNGSEREKEKWAADL